MSSPAQDSTPELLRRRQEQSGAAPALQAPASPPLAAAGLAGTEWWEAPPSNRASATPAKGGHSAAPPVSKVSFDDGGTASHADGGTASHADGGAASHADGGMASDAGVPEGPAAVPSTRAANGFVQVTPTPPLVAHAAPKINHEHGFLNRDVSGRHTRDDSRVHTPTAEDDVLRAAWKGLLGGLDTIDAWPDGMRAYRHFHEGNGAPLAIDYGRYLVEDSSGVQLAKHASAITRSAAIDLDNAWRAANRESMPSNHAFDMESAVFKADHSLYPATRNWMYALGAHHVWITAHVDVTVNLTTGERTFSIELELHAEDMYNFNPKDRNDTGIPDEWNGRFELSGQAHEFLTTGSATWPLVFSELIESPARTKQPHWP